MRKPWYSIFYIKSPIAKIGLGILSVLLGLALMAFLGNIEEQRMEAQTLSWHGRSIEKGADLFSGNCASCHGFDGKGLPFVAPALNSRYFFSQRTDDVAWAGTLKQYVEGTVHAGRPSKVSTQWANIMPTWGNAVGGPLRGDQVDQLVDYVLNYEVEAMEQTPEEDPWQFFQDALSKQLPYDPTEPGYDEKLAEALAAAEAAGAVGYEIGGVEVEVSEEDAGPAEARAPEDLFIAMGCIGCHNKDAPQDDDNKGPVGPNLGNLAENAATRVDGQDVETYVHASIVDPNAFNVTGYVAGIMPQDLATKMSEEEIQAMVSWLLETSQ